VICCHLFLVMLCNVYQHCFNYILMLRSEYGPVHMKVKLPKKTSCMYICQHCLVHLGDIGQFIVSSFYQFIC